MANLIKQKFLEGIDSSKFKIEQGGAIKAVDASGQLVDVFKFDAVNQVVKVFGDEEVAVASYVDQLMSDEVAARNAAINDAITDLINGAPQALDTLKELADKLTTEESALNALILQVSEEIINRQNAVSAEAQARSLADEALQDAIDQEVSDRTAAVSAEEAARIAADGLIVSDLTDLDGYAQDIREDLDNLLGSSSGVSISDLEAQISAEVSAREADVNSEESRAMMVESGLDTRLTTAEGDIDSLEVRMTQAESDINSEESRAMMVESGLDTRLTTAEGDIDSLEVRMTQAESDINSEESRAMMVESGLDTRLTTAEGDIDSLEVRMTQAESDINSEESRAMMVESGLDTRLTTAEGDIDSLEVRMTQAESDINSEESRAMLAEQGLQNNINVEKGRIDAILSASDADKDSFAEIVALINSVDTTSDNAFAAYVLSNNEALAQEVTDRQADVNAEEQRAVAAETALQGAIDAEAEARSDEDATFLKLDGSRMMTDTLKFDLSSTDFDQTYSHSEISKSGIEFARVATVDGDPNITLSLLRDMGFANFQNITDTTYVDGDGVTQTNYGNYKDARLNYYSGLTIRENSRSYEGTLLTKKIEVKNEYGPEIVLSNLSESEEPKETNISRFNHQRLVINEYSDNNYLFVGVADPYENKVWLNASTPNFHLCNGNGNVYIQAQGSNGTVGISGTTIDLAGNTRSEYIFNLIGFDMDGNQIPQIPFEPSNVVNKAYVDSQVSGAKTFAKESFEIDTSSELSYVDLSREAVSSSLVVFVNRLALHEGIDYSVEVVTLYDGDVTRITWIGDFATGGTEEIESGDVINVTYMY